ncbi:DUF5710 domain-containing protein [Ramlibacter sp. AN1133]|uniref:DUF5710 domain-containing protein n=1 Tax=Ramlibacter sp. AN1133 TaxID=3133429 RepID=UPI0030C0515D
MRIRIGRQYAAPRGDGGASPEVAWDPEALINGHLIMVGDSGSGKTHNLRSFLRQVAATAGPSLQRVHIFDTHGDIDVGGSKVQFSQSTPYAFNPLEVSPDPHFGGVRRAVANFLAMIQRARKLGTTQEAVLRNILFDVYALRGFNADNPATWGYHDDGACSPADLPEGRIYLDVPFEEKELAKDVARREGGSLTFDRERRCWWTTRHSEGLRRWPEKRWGKTAPTIHDVISLTQLKLKQLWVGVDTRGMFALENFCKATGQLTRALQKSTGRAGQDDPVILKEERERAADRAREAFEGFLERCVTGDEIDDLIRYESAQTLKSLLDRLENLKATGVCRSVPPPFDPDELVWRYEIRAYGDAERTIFVETFLNRLLERAMARGEVKGVTDIVVIDEAVRYVVDDSDHIICRLVQEARKFGIALFLISQSPTQFPEQILAGVGTKVILGLDPMYHRLAASKLGLDQKYIEAIKPRQLILVNRKLKSQVPQWIPTLLQ